MTDLFRVNLADIFIESLIKDGTLIPATDERLTRAEWEATIDYRPLADALHHSLCKWNHTDGCAYYYHQWDDELPDWHPKHDWLKKAETVFDAAVKGDNDE